VANFSGFAVSMPEDTKPEKNSLAARVRARLDKLPHSGAEMSVGAADTSVRATSGAMELIGANGQFRKGGLKGRLRQDCLPHDGAESR